MADDVRQVPEVRRPDVRTLIRKVQDGTVSCADLYRAYCEQMRERGRDPVSKKALGMALSACGQRVKVVHMGGKNVRCRIIREKFMASEDHDSEELSPRS
ncbi:MAG: hypothetical protein WCD24_13115 [Serratia inhibens]|uniref:hypothetical protein n=1 Tax=Serratia inhibens TaxID=2338073 RepID=UPI003C79CDD5